jgi:hypothetical protein
MMPSIARRAAARTHRFSRRMRAVALLLCLATWRGPLPWLHEHETDLQAAPGDAALQRHLASYHAVPAEAEEGWHLHLLLPFGRCPCEDSHEDSQSQDPLSLYGTLLTKSASVPASHLAASMSWDLAAAVPAVFAVPATIPTRPPPNRPSSFLASLLLQAPLRALTGVALC